MYFIIKQIKGQKAGEMQIYKYADSTESNAGLSYEIWGSFVTSTVRRTYSFVSLEA